MVIHYIQINMKIWPIIASFLLGALLVSLYTLNHLKPNIIADNYIASIEQNIKKLKVKGENNTVDLDIEQPKKEKFFKRVFKRKKEKL